MQNNKEGPPVPLLRGYFHVIGFYLTVVTAPLVLYLMPGGAARAGTALLTIVDAFLYWVSGIGHTTHFVSEYLFEKVFDIDRANVFLVYAANYTAMYAARCSAGVPVPHWPFPVLWILTLLSALRVVGQEKKTRSKVPHAGICCLRQAW